MAAEQGAVLKFDSDKMIWLAAVKIVRFQSTDRLGKTLNHYRKYEGLTKRCNVFQMTTLFALLNNSMQDTKKPLPMFSFICSPTSTFLHRHSPTKTFKPKSVFMPPVFWCNFNLQLFSSRWTLDLSIMQQYWHRVLTFCIVSFPRLHPDTMSSQLPVCCLCACVIHKSNQKQVRSKINHQVVGVMENRRLLIHVADE